MVAPGGKSGKTEHQLVFEEAPILEEPKVGLIDKRVKVQNQSEKYQGRKLKLFAGTTASNIEVNISVGPDRAV